MAKNQHFIDTLAQHQHRHTLHSDSTEVVEDDSHKIDITLGLWGDEW